MSPEAKAGFETTRPTRIGPYEIEGDLGRGGMGVVWRARDPRLDRPVAIKALAHDARGDGELAERLRREAQILADLDHPSVATVYGIEREGERDYIVMELVDGESLAERLLRGPLPVDDALRLIAQVAEGLEAAHEAGVVHRDLKPANIVLTARGAAKVLDFGLAARSEAKEELSRRGKDPLTSTGVALGSPGYMSPEQVRGKQVDRRSDLFALGCVLYECLTGRRAFGGADAGEAIVSLLEREPDWSSLPPSTPPRVRELLLRCLAKDLSNRQRDAGDVALELRSALQGREWTATRNASPPRYAAFIPWLVAVLGLAAGLLGWKHRGKERTEPVRAPRTVRFDLALPSGARLGLSDRTMNELAVSPDGSTIAYIVEEGGLTALLARRLDGREARRLVVSKYPRGPTFSPDGSWLAYLDDFNRLMKVPLAGGPPQQIGEVEEPGGTAAWLPDERIAFAIQASVLMEVDVASGGARVVAEAKGEFVGFENVAATPDESWLLVDGWDGLEVDDYRVMAVDRATGAVDVLVENASNPFAIGGDILVFQRGASLFAMSFDFLERRPLGEARLVVEGVATDKWGGSSQFAVSPSGTLVFAPGTRRGEGRRVVWVDPSGSVEPITADPDAFAEGVQFSADGSRMLLQTLRRREEVWTFDLVGRAMTPVVTGELYGAVLAPSGDEVFYCINAGGDSKEVRRTRVAGGHTSVLWKGPARPACVGAEGRTVLLADLDQTDIFLLDTRQDPPQLEPIIATAAREWHPCLSPDEKWLAYCSNGSGRPEVFVRAWPSGKRDFKVSNGRGETPRWAPDGRTLHYLDGVRLMAVELELSAESSEPRVETGEPREVLSNLAFAEANGYWIGDDGRVAMIELAEWERAESRLEVVVGWIDELHRDLAEGR